MLVPGISLSMLAILTPCFSPVEIQDEGRKGKCWGSSDGWPGSQRGELLGHVEGLGRGHRTVLSHVWAGFRWAQVCRQ